MLEEWLKENYRQLVAEGQDANNVANDIEKVGASDELVEFVRSLAPKKSTRDTNEKQTTRSTAKAQTREA
jgi:hypothetical protein